MNINFHYFAIKVLAKTAGFNERDAQLIAEYSQFVDDFHPFLEEPMACFEAPRRAKFLCKDTYDIQLKRYVIKFVPISTGFSGVDYLLLISQNVQENTVIPFHFIPVNQINRINGDEEKRGDRRNFCVKTIDNTPSLLNSLLSYTESLYKLNSKSKSNLIKLAIILHIFADTYAHQKFSGYWGWENSTEINKVIDNINNEDVTWKYKGRITDNLPSIGHANISTVPDESNLSFVINFKSNKNSIFHSQEYKRNNTIEFLFAARNILDYLRRCREIDPISDEDWIVLEDKLRRAFLTSNKRIRSLITHWKNIFNDIEFYYDENGLKKPSDNYFDFNMAAYEFREIILGNKEIPKGTSYIDQLIYYINDLFS